MVMGSLCSRDGDGIRRMASGLAEINDCDAKVDQDIRSGGCARGHATVGRVLIKWVVVRVGDLAEFRRGQLAWAEVGRCEGFVGQLGGWSRRDDAVAHIVGGWASEPSYHAFMADAHDRIAAAQVGTYDGIEVRLFDLRLKIGAGLFAATGDAGLLRLAHCHVPAHRRAHFLQAQVDVWNPGMTAC
jgi:hypothetical protein